MFTEISAACRFVLTLHLEGWTIVLYKHALPDDGPVRPETFSRLHVKTLL
jgi:hypothetical protein